MLAIIRNNAFSRFLGIRPWICSPVRGSTGGACHTLWPFNTGDRYYRHLHALGTSLAGPFFGILADRWSSRWLGIGACGRPQASLTATMVPGRYTAFVSSSCWQRGSGAYRPTGSLNIRRAADAHAACAASDLLFSSRRPVTHWARFSPDFYWHARACPGRRSRSPAWWDTRCYSPLAPHGNIAIAQTNKITKCSSPDLLEQSQPHSLSGSVLLYVYCDGRDDHIHFAEWLSDAGIASAPAADCWSTFSLAAAFGGIVGGTLADRWSRKWGHRASAPLASCSTRLLYAVPSAVVSTFVATACAGFAISMPQSVMIVVQNLFRAPWALKQEWCSASSSRSRR